MGNIHIRSLLLAGAILWAATALAYDTEVNGIYYNLDKGAKTAAVTHSNRSKYAGAVSIPKAITVEGVNYEVTSIQARAFDECTGLTAVSFPEGMETIGDFAFNGCSSLTAISLPNSVSLIRPYAFAGCTGLTTFHIPEKVDELLAALFDGCSNLVAVDIPAGVTTIDQNCFRDCTSLSAVTIPQGVRFIGYGAFRNCIGLTTVTLPQALYRMNSYAFDGCVNLKTVIANMPTPTGIDEYVFCEETYAGRLIVPSSSLTKYQQAPVWKNFHTIVAAEANSEGMMLVANLKDGSHEYFLLAEKPYFIFSGKFLNTIRAESAVVFDRNDIRDFTFENGTADGIKAIETRDELLVRQMDEGLLHISGLSSGASVSIYDLGGILLRNLQADASGRCEVMLPATKGVYFINIANKRTVKITRR